MDKSLLNRATEGSTAPTPGYLYNDIGKTLTSPQACIDTTNYLLNRLSKSNVHIKKKACKVLSKLIVHPVNRGMLKRTLAQNPNGIAAIKECAAWRGTMDAVRGDQWNVEVREAAKECLDVVYSDKGGAEEYSATSQQMMGGMPSGGMAGLQQGGGFTNNNATVQGIGGGGYGAPMGGSSGSGYGGGGADSYTNNAYGGAAAATASSSSSSRMEGIGNPMFSDPRLAQSSSSSSTAASRLGKMTQMASSMGGAMLGMIKDPLAKQAAAMQQQSDHPNMGTYNPNIRDPYSQPPGRNNLAMQTGGQWTMASNRGPNAIGGFNNNNGGMAPPPAEAPRHDDSEYYKARNATAGSAFNWASSSNNGAAAAAPTTSAAPAPSGGGVGGSWATAPVAPPPPSQPAASSTSAASTPQLSVAAQSRMDANQSTNPYSNGSGGSTFGVSGGFTNPNITPGEYEKNLISELCPPGGMKAEPPQDKLQEFAQSVPSLNPDLVCPALLDALEDGNPWIMRAKALCVIETVLKVMNQQQGETNPYSDFFHACASEIEPLASHARQSVKAPAKRVLGLLGVAPGTTVAATSSSPAAAPVVAAAEAPNLLDFGGPADVPPAPATAPPPPAPSANVSSGGGDSMFGGMTMKSGGSAAPSTNSPAAPAMVSTESTESSSGDLLGNFSVADPAPVAAPPAVPPPAAPASTGSSDLFGSMTVKSTSATVEVVAAPAPAATAPSDDASSIGPSSGGSAFGFMNTTTPSTPSRPAPTKAVAPASPAASYDPLLSLGATATTSTNNGAMNQNGMNPMGGQMNGAQMNPAQMQQMQMAYQQNMMMMQQQMQQMQMPGGAAGTGQVFGRQSSNPNVMGANYMRQVPGVQGDNSSFSFLGAAPKKKETHEFDFVKDAMKRG